MCGSRAKVASEYIEPRVPIAGSRHLHPRCCTVLTLRIPAFLAKPGKYGSNINSDKQTLAALLPSVNGKTVVLTGYDQIITGYDQIIMDKFIKSSHGTVDPKDRQGLYGPGGRVPGVLGENWQSDKESPWGGFCIADDF